MKKAMARVGKLLSSQLYITHFFSLDQIFDDDSDGLKPPPPPSPPKPSHAKTAITKNTKATKAKRTASTKRTGSAKASKAKGKCVLRMAREFVDLHVLSVGQS